MHTINIYRGESFLVYIKPDSSSTQVKKIMGENEIRLQFTSNFFINFQINDSATVFGEKYYIEKLPVVVKKSQYEYVYTMTMKAEGFMLSRAQFLFLEAENNFTDSEFTLMGTPKDFLDLIVENANRVSPGWIKGQYITADYKNLSFSMDNCYSALSRISQEYGAEYYIDGKTIHITKRQRPVPVTFKHGKGKGLYEIKRTVVDTAATITRLYAYGSDQNIPGDYRNFSKRLKMTGGITYVQKNTGKYGIIETTKIFEDIFPQRTGKVTSVDSTDIYKFRDATLDFNINDQLLGVPAKVVFNTGDLAGYTFDISSYTHGITKEIRINKNKDEKVLEIPNQILKPKIGDEYVLVDIKMPQPYIDAAEARLAAAAQNLLNANSEPLLTYQVELDSVYIKANKIELSIGDMVYLEDNELQISRRIRITETTRNIVNEYDIQVNLSDIVTSGPIPRLQTSIDANGRGIDQINRQLQNPLNNKSIGDCLIQQGTLIIEDIPTTSSTVGFSQLVMEDATGKIYKKI